MAGTLGCTLVIDDLNDLLFEDPHRTWALLRLWILADEQGHVVTAIRPLADAWGWSRERTTAVLRELAAGGWLRMEPQKGHKICYQLSGRGLRLDSVLRDSAITKEMTQAAKLPEPNPVATEASRLLHRHAECYTARFGQPFPVVWARDMQVYKRLVRVYEPDVSFLESLQDRFLNQSLDSFAGKRGFSVVQFAAECAGLAAQVGAQAQWSVEQNEAFQALRQLGMPEEKATALISECPLAVIRAQVDACTQRLQHGQPVSLRRLERVIRDPRLEAPPVEYPVFPVKLPHQDEPCDCDGGVQSTDGMESCSDESKPIPALTEFLTAVAMKV